MCVTWERREEREIPSRTNGSRWSIRDHRFIIIQRRCNELIVNGKQGNFVEIIEGSHEGVEINRAYGTLSRKDRIFAISSILNRNRVVSHIVSYTLNLPGAIMRGSIDSPILFLIKNISIPGLSLIYCDKLITNGIIYRRRNINNGG